MCSFLDRCVKSCNSFSPLILKGLVSTETGASTSVGNSKLLKHLVSSNYLVIALGHSERRAIARKVSSQIFLKVVNSPLSTLSYFISQSKLKVRTFEVHLDFELFSQIFGKSSEE